MKRLFLLAFGMFFITAAEAGSPGDAVVTYMKALYSSDSATVVQLMHKDTLHQIRKAYISELSQGSEGEGEETLRANIIESIKGMPDDQVVLLLYQTSEWMVLGKNSTQEDIAARSAIAKQSEFKITKETADKETSTVEFDATTPANEGNAQLVQHLTAKLGLHEEKWKVISISHKERKAFSDSN